MIGCFLGGTLFLRFDTILALFAESMRMARLYYNILFKSLGYRAKFIDKYFILTSSLRTGNFVIWYIDRLFIPRYYGSYKDIYHAMFMWYILLGRGESNARVKVNKNRGNGKAGVCKCTR